ncbi:hypothetical protein BD414DRAFT_474246 [Trametes punicea]|nr:hypothetical protein BD414DRAFT_474246 [Trametes punicea]
MVSSTDSEACVGVLLIAPPHIAAIWTPLPPSKQNTEDRVLIISRLEGTSASAGEGIFAQPGGVQLLHDCVQRCHSRHNRNRT